jgi:hypothetical protein
MDQISFRFEGAIRLFKDLKGAMGSPSKVHFTIQNTPIKKGAAKNKRPIIHPREKNFPSQKSET